MNDLESKGLDREQQAQGRCGSCDYFGVRLFALLALNGRLNRGGWCLWLMVTGNVPRRD